MALNAPKPNLEGRIWELKFEFANIRASFFFLASQSRSSREKLYVLEVNNGANIDVGRKTFLSRFKPGILLNLDLEEDEVFVNNKKQDFSCTSLAAGHFEKNQQKLSKNQSDDAHIFNIWTKYFM